MKPKHFPALGVLLIGLAAASLPAGGKPAPAQPTEQQKLKERVDALKAEVKELQGKSDEAAKERAYVEKIRSDTKEFYQQAFSSQTQILAITGIILMVLVALAGWFGFGVFDQRVQNAVSQATARLETKFDQKLGEERQKLETSNAAQLKQLQDDIRLRSRGSEHDLRGLALGIAGQYADALRNLRQAIACYKQGKSRDMFSPETGVSTIQNILNATEKSDPNKVEENAKNELSNPLYDDLEEELAIVALKFPRCAPVIRDRKSGPASTPKS